MNGMAHLYHFHLAVTWDLDRPAVKALPMNSRLSAGDGVIPAAVEEVPEDDLR